MSTTDVAIPDDEFATGLEDFDESDFVMPIIKINGQKGVFVDGLSGEEFPEMEVIVLGLVKNRILWEVEVSDNAPLCKSLDFHHGMPNPKEFPWKASGFDQSEYPEDSTLPCDACHLKEWGSHPKDDKPWCSEQHTYALLQPTASGFAPATLTVSRSGIKPSRAYLTSFARSKEPTFIVTTKLGLNVQKRGSVIFSVPTFARGTATDAHVADDAERKELFRGFAEQYRRIREFLQTPRQPEAEAVPVDEPSGTPAAAPASPAATDDDELPF